MNQHEKIKQAILSMVRIPKTIVMGEVTKVETETCSIKLADGLELPDVRLKQSIDNAQNYFVRSPKKGAQLTAISLNGDLTELMMMEASEYEFLEYNQNGLLFRIDSKTGKVTIKNDQVSMFDLCSDLVSLLQGFVVLTSNGPSSGIDANTALKIQQFETKYKQLLKQ